MGLIKLASVDLSKQRRNNNSVIAAPPPSSLRGLDRRYQLLVSLLPGAANLSQGLSPSYLPLTLHGEEVLKGLGPADSD